MNPDITPKQIAALLSERVGISQEVALKAFYEFNHILNTNALKIVHDKNQSKLYMKKQGLL